MPFGWESCWDSDVTCVTSTVIFSSSMPFGWESCWDALAQTKGWLPAILVINAFRLGVLLGHNYETLAIPAESGRHQCLSAGSPVGTIYPHPKQALKHQ